jgi:hypothetical protein
MQGEHDLLLAVLCLPLLHCYVGRSGQQLSDRLESRADQQTVQMRSTGAWRSDLLETEHRRADRQGSPSFKLIWVWLEFRSLKVGWTRMKGWSSWSQRNSQVTCHCIVGENCST